MDEPPAKETPPEEGLNKIDLSQLQDFRFGTQWTEIKPVPGSRREGEGERGPRREGPGRGERRPREGDGGDARRDRRSFRRPAGAPAPGGSGGTTHPASDQRPDRPPGDPRGGEGYRGRPMGREGGGERRWPGPHGRPEFRPPYVSEVFNVAFYPEDTGFGALAKAMRATCRTYELFEIARLILGKPDRFVVVLTRKPPGAPAAAPGSTPPGSTPAQTGGPIFMALPDGLPFETEDAAIAHVVGRHFDQFFDRAVVEVEPPKGSFPFVNRCTLSGELLGPPNYHRYQQIVVQHHAARFPRMPFEEFRDRIETVRDPAVVAQWLEKMKQATHYTWKLGAAGDAPVVFENLEEARAYAVAHARDRMIKPVETARFHGKLVDALPAGEIRRAIEGHFERQRRFPLDTANALRGRLRREGFTIFKKGAKGISYVCAVKRKFRVPGQVFAEGIGMLITFIEANPMIALKDLPVKLLGITPPSTPSTPPLAVAAQTAPAEPPAAPAEPAASAEAAAPAAPTPAAPAEPSLPPEQQEKLRRMTMDLRWLVQEGYVTEFGDGRLFTPPPMAEQRAKAAASGEEEHDPVAFPEVPAAEAQPAAEPPPSDSTPPSEPPVTPESSVPADLTLPPMDMSAPPAEPAAPAEPAPDAALAPEEPAAPAEPPPPATDEPPGATDSGNPGPV